VYLSHCWFLFLWCGRYFSSNNRKIFLIKEEVGTSLSRTSTDGNKQVLYSSILWLNMNHLPMLHDNNIFANIAKQA